ncbi:PRC-barrel domain-containing protein [Sphingomonas sp. 1P08PE]|jgi:membrane protein implicated in regulation of membrane protease activity|uniref:PRC-barrel domain-containing protein n=1 Tax=Sphingomonas sp. 1P08PE TaxID=554122 RepID=UPI00399FE112
MEQIAGWIAPAATMIAAMMTAANLGARVTGWGFAVFTLGSICWSILGMGTGQQGLLVSNAFLTVVNLVGIWRWLGRQAKHSDGSRRAAKRSERMKGPTLMSACTLVNAPVVNLDGETIATVVDAMVSREDRDIVYLVVARGGLGGMGEKLHPLDPAAVELNGCDVVSQLSAEQLDALPELEPDRWPGALPLDARLGAMRGLKLVGAG